MHARIFAAEAAHEGRRHILGQFYDEVCRKEWSIRAERGLVHCLVFVFFLVPVRVLEGDAGFDVEVACKSLDNELLKRARNKYASAVEAPAKGARGKGGQKGGHFPKYSKKGHGSQSSFSGCVNATFVVMLL